MHDKKMFRRQTALLQNQLTEEERILRSDSIWRQLENNDRFRGTGMILMYWSMPDEVATHDFIRRWHREKTIILPAVDGDILRLRRFGGEQTLRRNATLNLYEPQGDDFPDPQSITLAVIPGIAFDRGNRRLGRGKGYYDRLLPTLRAYKIGVCFDFRMFDKIPADEHDVLMNEVIAG